MSATFSDLGGYVSFRSGSIDHTEEWGDFFFIDYDEIGRILGVEVLA